MNKLWLLQRARLDNLLKIDLKGTLIFAMILPQRMVIQKSFLIIKHS